MAYSQIGHAVPAKLSFAKIVAMPAPTMAPAVPNMNKEIKVKPSGVSGQTVYTVPSRPTPDMSATTTQERIISEPKIQTEVEPVRSVIEALSLSKDSSNTAGLTRRNETVDSPTDDQSQISNSSLKQHSIETKSMASVTTFAMDEKESIRPDDSASVRAVDEDDVNPGISRTSSYQHEADGPVVSKRVAMRTVAPNVTIAARRYPGMILANPPRFGDLPVDTISQLDDTRPTAIEPAVAVPEIARSHLPVLTVTPDEKLLEALTSPKDRLPLLQLEERFVLFVTQSHQDVLQLPPQNSFTRLLTHKLADYYNLAHQVTEDNTSVRVFRTPCCSLPTSLAELAKSIPIGSSQAGSAAAHMKIMRRAQLGQRQFSAGNSTAASSSVPSKATSENGLETNSDEGIQSSMDGTPNRDKSKLTREEREAQYKAARERIFGDFTESVTSENGSAGETSASISRSSSSSGRRKARKQRGPKDDTFEARSAFVASYTPAHMQSSYQQPYSEMQFPGTYATPTSNYPQSTYGHNPMQGFPNYETSTLPYGAVSPYMGSEGWQSMPQSPPSGQYDYPLPAPYQPFPKNSSQMNENYPQMNANAMQLGWMGPQSHPSFNHATAAPTDMAWAQYNQTPTLQNSIPYQYGQLPPQGFHPSVPYNNQHPIPGSYTNTRSLFNPQTRSFVPNNSSGRGNGRGGRKKGGQTPNNNRSGNTSGTGSPALPVRQDNGSHNSNQASLQQKYGTPANLPKKPPPSQITHPFINDVSTAHTQSPSNSNSSLAGGHSQPGS